MGPKRNLKMSGVAMGRGRGRGAVPVGDGGAGALSVSSPSTHFSQTSSSSPVSQLSPYVQSTPTVDGSPAPPIPPNPPSSLGVPSTPNPDPPNPQFAAGSTPDPTPVSSNSNIPQKRKESSKKSIMWLYFTRTTLPNGLPHPSECICNRCGKKFPCDSIKNGTSSMWSHVNKQCPNHPERKMTEDESKQTILAVDNISGARVFHKYKKKLDEKLIAMIIKDELPFRFVEKEGFRELMREAVPEWPVPNRRQVARGVMDLFHYEKAILLSSLKTSETRISITTDTWTSIQNINYMVVTAHFLDNDWNLHKRIINFCPILSHKGEDIGRAVESCLRGWENFRIFTITVDNASSNDVAVQYLSRRLRDFKTLMFEGKFLHLRCACHIINLIVKDGLKELESGIQGIWNCAKYIRSSASRLEKFRQFAVEEQLRANANIPLDVVTRWNSTYLMLEAALKFEGVFGRMANEDAAFISYFDGKEGPPSYAEAFCHFLKKFYDATVKLSAWKSCTSNLLFVEMITIQTEIEKSCSSIDPIMQRVGGSMREKFNKYWGSFEVGNKITMIAHVLDPRYKMMWGKLAMQRIGASAELIDKIQTELKAILNEMYNLYKGANEGASQDMDFDVIGGDEDDEMDDISKEMARRMAAEQAGLMQNEVDQYLGDRYAAMTKVFDAASWWKITQGVYPVLSKLAKDILAIPVSTVASENAFSLGSRVVDPFRSSLTPTMVEALVCTSDWLRSEPINLEQEPNEDELEFYEELVEVEKEMAATLGGKTGTSATGTAACGATRTAAGASGTAAAGGDVIPSQQNAGAALNP